VLGHHLQNTLDIAARVGPGDLVDRGARRLAPVQQAETFGFQRGEDRPQPVGVFRVAETRIMIEAGGMGKNQRVHSR